MKYSFVAQNKKRWPVDVMCRLMGINKNSYYSYQRRHQNKPIAPEHLEMLAWVKKISVSSDHTYGSRRLRKALNALSGLSGRQEKDTEIDERSQCFRALQEEI